MEPAVSSSHLPTTWQAYSKQGDTSFTTTMSKRLIAPVPAEPEDAFGTISAAKEPLII
jgi:hypothetical protein